MLDGAQLVRRVVCGRRGAFRLEGIWLRPGKVISEQSLWPAPDWPSVPHLIEIFPSASGRGGHGGSRVDVVLWKFIKREWKEACAFRGYDSAAWMPALEPILVRSIGLARSHVALPDMTSIASKILSLIDREMSDLDTEDQRSALMTEIWLGLGLRECALQDSVLEEEASP